MLYGKVCLDSFNYQENNYMYYVEEKEYNLWCLYAKILYLYTYYIYSQLRNYSKQIKRWQIYHSSFHNKTQGQTSKEF